MLPIPHSVEEVVRAYAAPLMAAAVSGGLGLAGRGSRGSPGERPAMAALAGWAVLTPWGSWPGPLWSPHGGAAVLLAPAAVVAGLGLLPTVSAARPRLVAAAAAAFAGWWVARHMAGEPAFWRVYAGVALLPLLLRRTVGETPAYGLACVAGLSGALAIAGAAPAVVLAALVLTAVAAAEMALGSGVVPAVLVSALVGVADLSGGMAVRGRVGAVDLACAAGLAAPLLARAVQKRLGRAGRWAGVCGLAGAALSVGLLWFARRAFLT